MKPTLSVVIPFYNEEETSAQVLSELRAVLDAMGLAYEGVFVDDGSSDATGNRLRERCASWPEAKVVTMAQHSGQAAALLRGFAEAQGDWIATLDGDGQNDPADLVRLWSHRDSADMIIGIRARRQDTLVRRWMSRTANLVRSRFLGDGVRDTGCALKLFRREVVDSFLPIRTLYSFMPALAVGVGFRVAQIEVNHRPRAGGTSKYNLPIMLWRPFVDMIGIKWFLSRRIREHARQSAN